MNKKVLLSFMISFFIAFGLSSCSDSPDNKESEIVVPTKYSLWVTATNGSFILTVDNLMKDTLLSLANNKGIDITGYLPAAYHGVYAYNYKGYYYLCNDGSRFSQFQIASNGQFKETNNYAFGYFFHISTVATNVSTDDQMVFTCTSGTTNTEKKVLEKPIYFMDTKTMTIKKELTAEIPYLNYPVYQANGALDELYMIPTSMTIRKDKVFFGYKFSSEINHNDVIDSTFIYVCDYPSMQNGKVLKDARGGEVAGHWQISDPSFLDGNGNLYLLTKTLKGEYGLIRIKSGESEIDKSYFFNLKDYNIFKNSSSQIQVLANNKVYISPYIIDPGEKRVEADLRILTGGAEPKTTMNFVEDGKLYDVFETSDARWFVYQYDPASNTVKKGLEIDPGVSWVYHLNKLK